RLGEGELLVEQRSLLVQRVGAVVAVEAGLSHRDDLRVDEQPTQLAKTRCVRRRRTVRVYAQCGDNTVVALGDPERAATRVDARPDRHDPPDAGGASPRDHGVRLRARVEVGVAVAHAAVAGSSTRGKSGGAGSSSCTACVRPYAASSQATLADWPSASRMRADVLGRYPARTTATVRSPSTRS